MASTGQRALLRRSLATGLAALALALPAQAARAPSTTATVRVAGTGSGIVVDEAGHVLTNHHVVQNCKALRVRKDGTTAGARLQAFDPGNDLALLQATGLRGVRPAVLRVSTVQLGEPAFLAGYPLQGVLSNDLHVGTGMVSALAGPRGDRRMIQLSVPVQAGNSGGPVLDEAGQVIGVLLGTLSPAYVQRLTGLSPQNVSFAVRAERAQALLGSGRSDYRKGTSRQALDTRELAARARGFTVLIECLK
ncbi:MAG: serine protease [Gammaproteobacteria bacterium]|jgi:S1-C subfamily serine protease|nr:serine protease [Gammaproteobacteria bacterium]